MLAKVQVWQAIGESRRFNGFDTSYLFVYAPPSSISFL